MGPENSGGTFAAYIDGQPVKIGQTLPEITPDYSTDMPCIIRNLTDEQAITQMVEDNTNQRENILPSERAKALKMQLEAIKHQGAKNFTSGQLDPKDAGRRSNEVVAERNKMTVKQVQGDIEKFEAAVAFGEHTDGAADLINLTQNLDCYDFYPGIGDDEALGRCYVEELDAIDIPEHIRSYFDYEAYGRDIDLNSDGNFVPGGYVLRNGEPFREYYAGREDIPEEYRICRTPARNEKEETRSILETIRQFKEARPAPHKDREGPSHEGR